MRNRRLANAIILSLIVLLALAVRLVFYTGPFGSDDTWYYLAAHDLYDGAYQPSDNYWETRYGMLLPIAACYALFGTNEFAAAIWPMICSLGAIVVCAFLGAFLFDTGTGLLAALLMAFYPLDVHYSGLILPDIPLSFLMAASVLAFLHAYRAGKKAPVLFFLSGLLLGVAYSCRSMAVILLPFLGVYAVFFERKVTWSSAFFIVGVLTIVSVEGLYYYLHGLSPFHNFEINAQAALLVNASGECSTSQAYYPTVIFSNLSVFGVFFYLFIPALVAALVTRERGGLVLLAWAGGLLLILQFGFVSLHPPVPLLKVRKFLVFASVPLVLLGARMLMQLRGRFRWMIVAVLIGTSLFLLRPYTYSANATPETSGGNMRSVQAYLREMPPKTIWADGRTIGMLRLLSEFEIEPDRFRDLYEISSPYEIKHCYVVVNKFYARFDVTNPYASVPYFIVNYPKAIPPEWKVKDFGASAVLDVP